MVPFDVLDMIDTNAAAIVQYKTSIADAMLMAAERGFFKSYDEGQEMLDRAEIEGEIIDHQLHIHTRIRDLHTGEVRINHDFALQGGLWRWHVGDRL